MGVEQLDQKLRALGHVAVAFSGGVDSTYLLKKAVMNLGKENVLALTVVSDFIPLEEKDFAAQMAAAMGVRHRMIKTDVLKEKEIVANPANRCYICKHKIFREILLVAQAEGFYAICDGSNLDDTKDYRPGLQALQELGIYSPLLESGLGKAEIREDSKKLGLSTWNKPSMACLASRIPCGQSITEEKLNRIARSEAFLRELGFAQLRVRCLEETARIELMRQELPKILCVETIALIDQTLKSFGFRFVTLDLGGYQTGNMNERNVKDVRTDVERLKKGK